MFTASSGDAHTNAHASGEQTIGRAGDIYQFIILSYTNLKLYKTSLRV
jgi:hypothetical protein